MTIIYMECTIQLLALDKANHLMIQELLETGEHCKTEDGKVKYIKFENE